MGYTLFSGVAIPESTIGIDFVTASWVPCHFHTTRCDHSPCAELGFPALPNIILLDNHYDDRQKKKNGTLVD